MQFSNVIFYLSCKLPCILQFPISSPSHTTNIAELKLVFVSRLHEGRADQLHLAGDGQGCGRLHHSQGVCGRCSCPGAVQQGNRHKHLWQDLLLLVRCTVSNVTNRFNSSQRCDCCSHSSLPCKLLICSPNKCFKYIVQSKK